MGVDALAENHLRTAAARRSEMFARAREALSFRRDGLTFRQIGERMGISVSRAGQLSGLAQRAERYPEIERHQRSTRALNVLKNEIDFKAGWRAAYDGMPQDEAEARMAAEQFTETDLRALPNCGRVTIEEIRAWLAEYDLTLKVDARVDTAELKTQVPSETDFHAWDKRQKPYLSRNLYNPVPVEYFYLYMQRDQRAIFKDCWLEDPDERVIAMRPLVENALARTVWGPAAGEWQIAIAIDRLTMALTRLRGYSDAFEILNAYFALPDCYKTRSTKNTEERLRKRAERCEKKGGARGVQPSSADYWWQPGTREWVRLSTMD